MLPSIVGALLLAGCARILDLEVLPAKAQRQVDAGQGVDAPAPLCSLGNPRPCDGSCPHQLCDDFDSADGTFPDWIPTLATNPYLLNGGTLAFAAPGAQQSAYRLVARVPGGASKSSAALVSHRMEVPVDVDAPSAVVLAFDMRVESASFAAGDGGTDESAVLASLSAYDARDRLPGIALALRSDGLTLLVANDLLFADTPPAPRPILDPAVYSGIRSSWLRYVLFLGTAEAAARASLRSCPRSGMVVAASLLGSPGEVCVTAPPTLDRAALRRALASVGPTLRAEGAVEIHYDNVFVDRL
ncbi:MAG: hypothetical protein HOO96_13680 [Polyangiaceae bacterium]|nr:hypothetical protein [Polyangiaceae bacterium]